MMLLIFIVVFLDFDFGNDGIWFSLFCDFVCFCCVGGFDVVVFCCYVDVEFDFFGGLFLYFRFFFF